MVNNKIEEVNIKPKNVVNNYIIYHIIYLFTFLLCTIPIKNNQLIGTIIFALLLAVFGYFIGWKLKKDNLKTKLSFFIVLLSNIIIYATIWYFSTLVIPYNGDNSYVDYLFIILYVATWIIYPIIQIGTFIGGNYQLPERIFYGKNYGKLDKLTNIIAIIGVVIVYTGYFISNDYIMLIGLYVVLYYNYISSVIKYKLYFYLILQLCFITLLIFIIYLTIPDLFFSWFIGLLMSAPLSRLIWKIKL